MQKPCRFDRAFFYAHATGQPCEFSWFCVAKCELCEQMETRVSKAVKQPLNTCTVACAVAVAGSF